MTTILVVDDLAVDRRLVGELLSRESAWTIAYAENGSEAIEWLKDAVADLVLTDLQMPEMDGLDLVGLIRVHHPSLPVVLMTAYGSEALAIEALERGAASYVPKSQLADRLLPTVKEVLALAHARRSYDQLIDSVTRTEFAFSLDNDVALIDSLVHLVQQMVFGMGLCDATERLRVGVALHEALCNALFHGNLEIGFDEIREVREKLLKGQRYRLLEERRAQPPYCDRRISVDVKLSPEEGRFVVRDQGPGFDVATVPDPGDPSSLETPRGRGLSLMRAFMDEVTYNAAGNEVTLVKRRARAGDQPHGPSS